MQVIAWLRVKAALALSDMKRQLLYDVRWRKKFFNPFQVGLASSFAARPTYVVQLEAPLVGLSASLTYSLDPSSSTRS